MTKEESIALLNREVQGCQKCRLFQGTTNAVPGSGSAEAQIMFVGEAPGFHEDQQGLPFVGRAGKLLDQLLSQIGLTRGEVFVANVIKHRPPENRDPFPDEVKACKPYLDRQLEIIDPQVIVSLGRFGLNYFFPDGKISQDHGVPRFLGLRLIFPVYHPAAALRNPEVMKSLRVDFMEIPRILEKRGELLYKPLQREDNSDQMELFS